MNITELKEKPSRAAKAFIYIDRFNGGAEIPALKIGTVELSRAEFERDFCRKDDGQKVCIMTRDAFYIVVSTNPIMYKTYKAPGARLCGVGRYFTLDYKSMLDNMAGVDHLV